jgi:hypothetical protein
MLAGIRATAAALFGGFLLASCTGHSAKPGGTSTLSGAPVPGSSTAASAGTATGAAHTGTGTGTASAAKSSGSAKSSQPSGGSARAACGDGALDVSAPGGPNSATGHSAVVLVFRNRQATACSVTGYPGVDALAASGAVLAHASRTLSGFAGGARAVTTVAVGPGQSASATLEWMLFNPATGGDCATSVSIAVTPANTRRSVNLPVHVTTCELQIHPTVAGTSGRSGPAAPGR